MNNTVVGLGVVFLLVGVILIFYYDTIIIPNPNYDPFNNWSNEPRTLSVNVFRYQGLGVILVLIGFVTLVIGGEMADKERDGEKEYEYKHETRNDKNKKHAGFPFRS